MEFLLFEPESVAFVASWLGLPPIEAHAVCMLVGVRFLGFTVAVVKGSVAPIGDSILKMFACG